MQLPIRPAGVRRSQGNRSAARVRTWRRSAWRLLRGPMPRWARPIFLAVIPLVLLAVLVFALLFLLGGTEVRSLEQSQYDSDTGSSSTSRLAQSFLSPRANLSRIDVQLALLPN